MGHEKSLKHPSNSYPGQLAGYVLAGTAAFYLEARYGGEWQQVSELSLQATDPPLLMNDFRPGVGCCTIAALTATFRQIGRTYGRSLIPVDEHDLFDQIESLAAHHGYRPKRGNQPFMHWQHRPPSASILSNRWQGRIEPLSART